MLRASVQARHRADFLLLADRCLASSLLPAHTAAAFAKRFARLALTAPPAGALLCLAFVHNIVRCVATASMPLTCDQSAQLAWWRCARADQHAGCHLSEH